MLKEFFEQIQRVLATPTKTTEFVEECQSVGGCGIASGSGTGGAQRQFGAAPF